jgi:hypothetical protein
MPDVSPESDHKMKLATTEIVGVMKKYDLCGALFLTDPEQVSHYVKLDASWTCTTYDGQQARILLKADMYPSKETQNKCISESAGTVMGLIDTMKAVEENLTIVAEMIGKHVPFNHMTRKRQ